jgi:hypothetical protein
MNPNHPEDPNKDGPGSGDWPDDLEKALNAFAAREPAPQWLNAVERSIFAQTEDRSLRPTTITRVTPGRVLALLGGIAAVLVLAWGLWSHWGPGLGVAPPGDDQGPGPQAAMEKPKWVEVLEPPASELIAWEDLEARIRQTEALIARRRVQDELEGMLAQFPIQNTR